MTYSNEKYVKNIAYAFIAQVMFSDIILTAFVGMKHMEQLMNFGGKLKIPEN